MVPGLTERERLAADMQRLEWLADAVLGPVHTGAGPMVPKGSRHFVPSGLVRRGIAMALTLGRHARHIWPRTMRPLPEQTANQIVA